MRKKRVLITVVCVVFVLLAAALSVLMIRLRHKHQLGDAKTYHICNDRVYYTRQCVKDKHIQVFESDKTFAEVIESLSNRDKIVIDEDIEWPEAFKVTDVLSQAEAVNDIEINIDLNGKTINSMFEISVENANFKFNISNGVINSGFANAIKVNGANGKVELNILNVECYAMGSKNAPLYIENASQVLLNANNSKFISLNTSVLYYNYGVGVFVNAEGDFNFKNCILEGGDGLHVRQGNILLEKCNLINTGLTTQAYQSVDCGFSAVGASLAAHCYTTETKTTNFKIVVDGCTMITNNSNRVIYIYKVSKAGYDAVMDPDSCIDIKSCKFDENPNAFYNQDKVVYVGGSVPANNGQGYWIVGNFAE